MTDHLSQTPWREGQPGRVPPRECIANARDALNRAYGMGAASDRHLWAFMAEALDWQRRAIEQIAATLTPPGPPVGADDDLTSRGRHGA